MKKRVIPYFLLLAISYLIAYGFVVFVGNGTLRSFKFSQEGQYLVHFGDRMHLFLSDQDYNRIQKGETLVSTLPVDLQDTLCASLKGYSDRSDAWGNSYSVVHEIRNDARWIGIYSLGADGKSTSQGNDPDDLNSWGQDGMNHYPEVIENRLRFKRIQNTLVFGSILSMILICAYEFKKVVKST